MVCESIPHSGVRGRFIHFSWDPKTLQGWLLPPSISSIVAVLVSAREDALMSISGSISIFKVPPNADLDP